MVSDMGTFESRLHFCATRCAPLGGERHDPIFASSLVVRMLGVDESCSNPAI